MPSLEELLDDVAETTVQIRGIEVNVKYHPNRSSTLDELADMAEAEAEGETGAVAEFTAQTAADFLIEWDLTKGGQVIPITVEDLLTQVPTKVLQQIMTACREDAEVPNSKPLPMRSKSRFSESRAQRRAHGRGR